MSVGCPKCGGPVGYTHVVANVFINGRPKAGDSHLDLKCRKCKWGAYPYVSDVVVAYLTALSEEKSDE